MRNSQSFFFKLCEYFENQSHFWSFLIKFSYCSIALLVKMESCNISLSQRVEGGFQWIWTWTWTCVYAFCFWQPFYHVLSFRVQVWHTRSILLCIVIENHIHAHIHVQYGRGNVQKWPASYEMDHKILQTRSCTNALFTRWVGAAFCIYLNTNVKYCYCKCSKASRVIKYIYVYCNNEHMYAHTAITREAARGLL